MSQSTIGFCPVGCDAERAYPSPWRAATSGRTAHDRRQGCPWEGRGAVISCPRPGFLVLNSKAELGLHLRIGRNVMIARLMTTAAIVGTVTLRADGPGRSERLHRRRRRRSARHARGPGGEPEPGSNQTTVKRAPVARIPVTERGRADADRAELLRLRRGRGGRTDRSRHAGGDRALPGLDGAYPVDGRNFTRQPVRDADGGLLLGRTTAASSRPGSTASSF